MSLLNELQRRNVFRVGAAYLVAAWLLLQVTDVVAPILGLPGSVPRTILILLAIGFVVALVFAWVYELTEDGLKREVDVDRARSITGNTGRKLDFMIIGLLLIAVVFLVLDNYVLDRQPGTQSVAADRSIAVLPFRSLSSRQQDAFFADGIHGDLLTQLSRIASLDKVISQTSTERFRDRTQSIRDIGRELGVVNVVEGGVQRAGDRVRINVQLVDSRTDRNLWANSYDRELTAENLFDIQSEITREIVAALHGVLNEQDETRVENRPTASLAAYEEFSRGRKRIVSRSADDIRAALQHFEKAVEIDPEYALAWVGIADANAMLIDYAGAPPESGMEAQKQAVDKALALDPLSGEAYANLGLLNFRLGNPDASDENFMRSIELSPNYATAYHWYSLLLVSLDRREEALQMARKALVLDPMAPILTQNLATNLIELSRYAEAEDVLLDGIHHNPQFAGFYAVMGNMHDVRGNLADAALWMEQAVRLRPTAPTWISQTCFLHMQLGNDEAAEACVADLENRFPQWPPVQRAMLMLARGEIDSAETLVASMAETHSFGARIRAFMYPYVGETDALFALYQELFPDLMGEQDVTVQPSNVVNVVRAGMLLYATGDLPRANYLFDSALNAMATMSRFGTSGIGLLDAEIHAWRSEPSRAITALRDAIQSGYSSPAWYLTNRPFDNVENDAEWRQLVTQAEAQRERLLQRYLADKDKPLVPTAAP